MTEIVPYTLLGGEDGVRRLCKAFYEQMKALPQAEKIKKMHKEDTSHIEGQLFKYLSTWLGGPPLYIEDKGSMCITEAHRPFAIGMEERDQWVLCFDMALEDIGASEEVKAMLKDPIFRVADMVRNKKEKENIQAAE